jgi:hypothetical protein
MAMHAAQQAARADAARVHRDASSSATAVLTSASGAC